MRTNCINKKKSVAVVKTERICSGEKCPKCNTPMGRFRHAKDSQIPRRSASFSIVWDKCPYCKTIHKYPEYIVPAKNFPIHMALSDTFLNKLYQIVVE
jgi:hypothetical protein